MRSENSMSKSGSCGSRTCGAVSICKKVTRLSPGEWKVIGVLAAWSALAVCRERSLLFLALLAVLLYSSYTDFAEQYVYNLPVALFFGVALMTLAAGKVWENEAFPAFLGLAVGVLLFGLLKLWGLGDSLILICIGLWSLTLFRNPLAYQIWILTGLLIASAGFILAFLITGKKKGPFVPYLTAGFLIETVFLLYS